MKSALLKLDWAKDRLAELDGLFAALQSPPHFVWKIETDPTKGMVLRFGSRFQPPDVPMLLGDAFHALRSALDHAIFALINPKPNEVRKTQFPISKNIAELKVANAFTFIAAQKPKVAEVILNGIRPTDQDNPMLFDIHNMDIINKHRLLLATTTLSMTMLPTVVDPSSNVSHRNVAQFKPGYRYTIPLGPIGSKITGKPSFSRTVIFTEQGRFYGTEVRSTLKKAIRSVGEVLDRLKAST